MKRIAGSSGPYKTGSTTTRSDKDSTVVEVEGELSQLQAQNPSAFCPPGMVVENSIISPTVGGHGKLSVRCINYGSGNVSTTPTRITWKISMAEVNTELFRHPHFDAEARKKIELWLSTDVNSRYADNGNPQYIDKNGAAHPLTGLATDYVTAYKKGIETYVRHFPVVEKISYYKTLPGCSMTKNSTTSGTVSQFSGNIDKWDVPSVKLSGFSNSGWFKSGDSYDQANDLVWTRVEQWTWTPDGSGSNTGWIYRTSQS